MTTPQLKELDYSDGARVFKAFCDVLVIQPNEADINPGSTMHEGALSTALGLKASPTEAETMRLKRDLNILEYTGEGYTFPLFLLQIALSLSKKQKRKD